MRQHPLVNGTTIWDAASMNPSDAYKESISYDANGNIQTFVRNGKEGNVLMDNLVYMYEVDPVTGKKLSNKLRQVKDGVAAAAYAEDLDNQESEDNYQYDAIGNLTKDIKEGITAIDWTVYGKISSIAKAGSTINYTYDASGNRVSKTVTPTNGTGVITFYVRDAQGNSLGIYERDTSNQILWKEQTLYGSSRLGMFRPDADVSAGASDTDIASKLWANYVGYQNYELGNHLGNVLAVISDKRTLNNSSVYEADVVSASDYTPFGMHMVGRTYTGPNSNYRYGMNGQEKDEEVAKGIYNAKYWEYDSRIGRRWNIDPVVKHDQSSYSAFANNPIFIIDPLGADSIKVNSGGYISQIVKMKGNHVLLDYNNNRIHLNDPEMDTKLINKREISVGDKLVTYISSSQAESEVDGQGKIEERPLLKYYWGVAGISPKFNYFKAIAEIKRKSYEGWDFSHSVLSGMVNADPNSNIGDRSRRNTGMYRDDYKYEQYYFFIFGNTNKAYNLGDAGNFCGEWLVSDLDLVTSS